MSPPVTVAPNRSDTQESFTSRIYKFIENPLTFITTPLYFISFLISLALVDLRNTARRAHYHGEQNPPRVPSWLHRAIFYQPSRSTTTDRNSSGVSPGQRLKDEAPARKRRVTRGGLDDDYYHSHQRKLLRMEAEEAFEMRRWVMIGLIVISLGLMWMSWKLVSWGLGAVKALLRS